MKEKTFYETMVDFKKSLKASKSDEERLNLYERCYWWLNNRPKGLSDAERIEAISKLIYSMTRFINESGLRMKDFSKHWDWKTVKDVGTYVSYFKNRRESIKNNFNAEEQAKFAVALNKIEDCKDFHSKAYCYCMVQDGVYDFNCYRFQE